VNVYRHPADKDRPVCRHRKSPSCDGFNHWSIRAGNFFCSMYQRNRSRPEKPDADESYMALTFGTLLSSQGADAHRRDPFGPIRGNLRYATRSVPRGQTRPALPGLPLGRGDSRGVLVPRAWGNARPAPPDPRLSRGSLSWLRHANNANISDLPNSAQIPRPGPRSPVFVGVPSSRHRRGTRP
jgi:hypothetical protein